MKHELLEKLKTVDKLIDNILDNLNNNEKFNFFKIGIYPEVEILIPNKKSVTYDQCLEFAKSHGCRLPTHSELLIIWMNCHKSLLKSYGFFDQNIENFTKYWTQQKHEATETIVVTFMNGDIEFIPINSENKYNVMCVRDITDKK